MTTELKDDISCHIEMINALEADLTVMEELEALVGKYGIRRCLKCCNRLDDEGNSEFVKEFLLTLWVEDVSQKMDSYITYIHYDDATHELMGKMLEKEMIGGIHKGKYKGQIQRLLDCGMGYMWDGMFHLGEDKPKINRGLL